MKRFKEYTNDTVAVYLDLDGVFADFDKKGREIYPHFEPMHKMFHSGERGPEYNKHYKNLLFSIMRTEDFWKNLDWMHDGPELFNFVKNNFPHDNIGVLTAPMRQDKRCDPHKWEWVQKNFKIIQKSNFFCDEKKWDYVGKLPGAYQVLIDDRLSNITKWSDAGGIGIHHTTANKTIKELKELLVEINK